MVQKCSYRGSLRSLHSNKQTLLKIHIVQTSTFGIQAFSVVAAKRWNALLVQLRRQSSFTHYEISDDTNIDTVLISKPLIQP